MKQPHHSDNDRPAPPDQSARSPRSRLLPILVLVGLIAAFFASGLHRSLDFDALALEHARVAGFISANPLLATLAAGALYALAVALAFPAPWLLTVAAGLFFGWLWGAAIVVVAATLGASIIFWAAARAFAPLVRRRAGARLARMAQGFRDDALNYMLFLRLAPVFSFTLVNIAAGVLGVPYRIFALSTALGVVPGTIAYCYAGEGLRALVAARARACRAGVSPCGDALSPADFITPQILVALSLLAVVSLIPVAVRRLRAR